MNMIPVNSSNLAAVGYECGTLRILFNSGWMYDYMGVPEDVYVNLLNASSKGSYHAEYIKNSYPYHRIR